MLVRACHVNKNGQRPLNGGFRWPAAPPRQGTGRWVTLPSGEVGEVPDEYVAAGIEAGWVEALDEVEAPVEAPVEAGVEAPVEAPAPASGTKPRHRSRK